MKPDAKIGKRCKGGFVMNTNNTILTNEGKRALIAPWRWMIVQGVVYFAAAGTLEILRAWLYFAMILVGNLVGTYIGIKVIPGTYNERGSIKADTKRWDIVLLSIYFIMLLIFVPLVSGLDVGRYQWGVFKFELVVPGLVLFFLLSAIITWSLLENRHFEGTVRIQADRDHQVISSGPYRFVRHPGYIAMICTSLLMPVILGSRTGLIPAAIAAIALVIRTYLEDRTLKRELAGYEAFAKKVKYRLFPGIW